MTAEIERRWPPDFWAWRPEDWSALAAWITIAVAFIAGLIALWQVLEARALRKEQAQPYVTAFMEPTAADPQLIDIVVRNFGTTAAHDITMAASPPLQRSGPGGSDNIEDVWIPSVIPILAPGQEWRTFWDFGRVRLDTELPDRHELVASFRDSRGKSLEIASVLDWSQYKGRRWVELRTVHHAAKALQSIDATMKKWREDPKGGLAVFVRDGRTKDEGRARRFEEWRERTQAREAEHAAHLDDEA